MTSEQIIQAIQEHSLTVRCLPHVVTSLLTYREGDEERVKQPVYDSEGNVRDVKREVVFNEAWGRKFVKSERKVERGGWWLVKQTKNTDSTVRFSMKANQETFFAPTLEEAIQKFLDTID